MLIIECANLKKYYGDRLILEIDHLEIHHQDRIGIVGVNGIGKTTLINLLCQRLKPDEGWVKLLGSYAYMSQLGEPNNKMINLEVASKFRVANIWDSNLSGGEKTRFKLASCLKDSSDIIFADEPTSNMDLAGIKIAEESFLDYKGALVVISHDRDFLDKLCNKILEVENGKIYIYQGNYSDYYAQKLKKLEREQFEYEQYVKEKRCLELAVGQTKEKVKNIKRAPKRMGNSESRLHKMGGQKAKANLDRAAKNILKRIEHLEIKEKPKDQEKIRLEVSDNNKLYGKLIIEAKNINKSYGDKIIFKNANFSIYKDSKIAIIGPNGCGKSTLIKMIVNNDCRINVKKSVKIGYFSQEMNILDENLSILENVMESSIYTETNVRNILARLLFKKEDVYKKVKILSGGERVKASFAKILSQDINLLVLDEPTNYMDIQSLEVIEAALKDYTGNLLFVSHDRRLIASVANQIMTIDNYLIQMFDGNYQEYLARQDKTFLLDQEQIKNQIFLLENRLTIILGKLSQPSKKDDLIVLNNAYHKVLEELKQLKGEV